MLKISTGNPVFKLSLNQIFYFLIIIPFIPLQYFVSSNALIAYFYSGARYLVIILLLFRRIKFKRIISVPFLLCILLIGVSFLSTYFSGYSLYYTFSCCIFLFGITLLVEDGIYFDIDSFVAAFVVLFEILIYLNLIYYILFPNGYGSTTDKFYLFGNYNTTMRKLFPGVILGGLYAYRRNGRITLRYLCMIVALFAFLILVNSLTAIFGILIFIIGIVFFCVSKHSGIFRYEIFFIASIVLTVVFAVLGNFSFLASFITNFLGRDMTLSTRTTVWSNAIALIRDRPLWGYGQIDGSINKYILGASTAHNVFLDFLYYSGVIGLVILISIVVIIGLKIATSRKSHTFTVALFDCAFCAYFIMWVFEPFGDIIDFYMLFSVFSMAYYLNDFEHYTELLLNNI